MSYIPKTGERCWYFSGSYPSEVNIVSSKPVKGHSYTWVEFTHVGLSGFVHTASVGGEFIAPRFFPHTEEGLSDLRDALDDHIRSLSLAMTSLRLPVVEQKQVAA